MSIKINIENCLTKIKGLKKNKIQRRSLFVLLIALLSSGCFNSSSDDPQKISSSSSNSNKTIYLPNIHVIETPEDIAGINSQLGIKILPQKEPENEELLVKLSSELSYFYESSLKSRYMKTLMIVLSNGYVEGKRNLRKKSYRIGRMIIIDLKQISDAKEISKIILKTQWLLADEAYFSSSTGKAWSSFNPPYKIINMKKTLRNRKGNDNFVEYNKDKPGYLTQNNGDYSANEETSDIFASMMHKQGYCELRSIMTVDPWINQKAKYLLRQMNRLDIHPKNLTCPMNTTKS